MTDERKDLVPVKQTIQEVFSLMGAMIPTHARLMSVNAFLVDLLGEEEITAKIRTDVDHHQFTFGMDNGFVKGTIEFRTWTLAYPTPKRVTYSDTALAMNALLRDINGYWENQTEAVKETTQGAQQRLVDFIMKVFVRCSESTRYTVESDDGYWHCLFCDPKSNISMEISLQAN